AIVTEEISAKDISVTYNAIGDHSKHVDEGVSVSSPKDGQLIVADAGATGSIPEALEGDQTNKIQNDDDVPSEKSSEHTPSPQDFGLTGDFGESLPIVTPLKVQRPHDDGSYSSIDRSARIPDIAIPEYIPQNTPEKDIKKELGEEVGKNVMEDVGSTKMEQVSVHNEEKEIADDNNQLKAESTEAAENKYLAELSDQERILADFLFYSEYKDVSILSIDENNPAVIQQNEELRHNLECSVLLDIVNPANPDMHMLVLIFSIEEKKKNLELPADFGLTYFHFVMFCNFLQGNRIKRRGFDGLHHWNRRTIPFTWRSNQNDFDCGVYCIKAMEWYDDWNEKKHPITTLLTNLSRCHLAIDLVSYKENRRKQEVFKECALWSARKPILIEQQKKRKDKEKHLENLRVKRVEKVFVEDEKIRKERKRHEQ
ncbi:Protoheme IX farnesyltransferase, partial [Bienertia sinuspersici]